MTLSTTMLASDLAYMIADLPTSVVIGSNAACNAVVTDLSDANTLEMAGVMPEQSISIHVPVTSLTVTPEVGQKVTIATVEYRILTVRSSSDGIEYILDCEATT